VKYFFIRQCSKLHLKPCPFKIRSEFERPPLKELIIAASELSGQSKYSGNSI
jgi:hypothetical protein